MTKMHYGTILRLTEGHGASEIYTHICELVEHYERLIHEAHLQTRTTHHETRGSEEKTSSTKLPERFGAIGVDRKAAGKVPTGDNALTKMWTLMEETNAGSMSVVLDFKNVPRSRMILLVNGVEEVERISGIINASDLDNEIEG